MLATSTERSCERYDIISEKWCLMPENATFDQFARYISVVVTSARFLHAFGGRDAARKPSDLELVRTFDHLKPQAGWRILSLKRPIQSGFYHKGLMNLGDSILLFGGLQRDFDDMDGSVVFSLKNETLEVL